MIQILQNLSNGKTSLVDVPCPKNIKNNILISTSRSVISAGTERMLIEFGKANLLEKARQQPSKVNMVLNKIRTDGLFPTLEAVKSKLDQPLPLGYCNSGIVIDSSVKGLSVGDRVVSNGYHAEVVRVPKNLCAKIPDNVDDESAGFTVLGSIGLQGIRLIQPTIGETIIVTGLGLIGLMCVQMLRANGCRVLGIDYDTQKCNLAKSFGAEIVDLSKGEDPLLISHQFTRGRGCDAVLVTAASKSNKIIQESAKMCRKRGRIVLVGVIGLDINREDFFEKEITFQVSASYGPGRYDSMYEEEGHDYPIGFVRWTEQRNFEAVLDMMSSGVLDVNALISHRFKINDAIEAYELLNDSSSLGIVLEYTNKEVEALKSSSINIKPISTDNTEILYPSVGFIGCGNYASRILIPAFKKSGAKLFTLVSSGGVSGVHYGKKYDFKTTSTDIEHVLQNDDIDTVVIVTRHDVHAKQVIAALNANKNVFVEKPIALTLEELSLIDSTYKNNSCELMVGFNRRFAPHIIKMKELLDIHRSPKTIIITVNAGSIASNHWVQNSKIGGGRIIGEACHFVDLMRFLIGCQITNHQSMMMGDSPGIEVRCDKVTINLSFLDGSFGAIHYIANGGSAFPKERVEVFCDDAVLQMDNYRTLKGYGWKGFKKMKLIRQDKGQQNCTNAFIECIKKGGDSPIPYDEIIESSRISIEIDESLRS